MLSVILPAYNEEQMIRTAATTISGILDDAHIDFEMLFINDGSKDRTWNKIEDAASGDPRVRGICFSRNFGKEAAVFAGLNEAKGDCVVVLDCDLQHPPEKIVDMYRLWEQGYEVVEGVKTDRGKESGAHSLAAKIFYMIISKAAGFDMENASDFKLLDRKAVNVLINMREKNAFFRALSSWIGFQTTTVSYEVQERMAGESKWSTRALIRYAITNITSFSAAPLQFVTIFGMIMFIVSAVLGVIAIYQKITGVALGGFTTMILLQGFSASIIMISLGVIGYYLEKIYEEIKGRPRYIISKQTKKSEKSGKFG